jgi:hypothetical protein
MRRLALSLLAAVAATGCVGTSDTCDVRNVTVTWNDGFDGPDAAFIGRLCPGAGVGYVDLFLDGQYVGRWNCGDYGATITGVQTGSYTLTAEGISGNGSTILYRQDVAVNVSGCGDFAIAVVPGAGTVNLQYAFFQNGAMLPPAQQVCAPSSFLWLSIFDVIANQGAVLSDAGSNPNAYTCGGTFQLALPEGNYTLDWMEERGPGGSLESADCSLRPFTLAARATTPVPVDLAIDALAACTR